MIDKDEALKLAIKRLERADRITGHPNNKHVIEVLRDALKKPESESEIKKLVAIMESEGSCRVKKEVLKDKIVLNVTIELPIDFGATQESFRSMGEES